MKNKYYIGIVFLFIILTFINCNSTKSNIEVTAEDLNVFHEIEKVVLNAHSEVSVKYENEKEAAELFALIEQDKFEEMEEFISRSIDTNKKDRDGFMYFQALLRDWFSTSGLRPFPESVLPHLNNWVEKHKRSAIAYIVRGTYYDNYAWEARGCGWAKDVSESAWKLFHERMELAEKDFKIAIELEPSNPHGYIQMLRVLTRINTPREVVEDYFQQTMNIVPNNFHVYSIKVDYLMPKWFGTWDSMFEFARDTEQNAPPKTLLPLILFYAYEEAAARSENEKQYYANREVWEDINRVFKRVITDFPHSGTCIEYFAEVVKDSGKDELAIKYLELAKKADPEYYEPYEELALIYEQQEKWKLEEENARKLIQLHPDYHFGHALLGYSLKVQEKYPEAITSYSKAIKLKPTKSNYWRNLSYLYNKTAKYEKAIEACSKAIELDPENYEPYEILAKIYEQQQKWKLEEENARKVIQLRPDYHFGYALLGYSLRGQQKDTEAITSFSKALKLEPTKPNNWQNLCYLYNKTAKYDKAIDVCSKAIEIDPQYYEPYEILALIYEQQKKWKLEEENARKLIQLYPDYHFGYSLLGYSLSEQQKCPEAIVSYSKALELEPTKSNNWQQLCYLYTRTAKYDKAIDVCSKAIEIDKENEHAYYNRSQAFNFLGKDKESNADRLIFDKLHN